MKFKSDIEVQAGLKDSSGSNGTSGQILSSNGTTVSWVPAGSSVANDVQNQVKAGVAINKGQAVYVTSADGTNIIVGLASNTTEATSSKTLGLLNATVAINGFADVVQIGRLTGLNTLAATVGDPVWLGADGNLIYGLANKPYAPLHLVFIGVVTRVNASNGEIFVNVQNGFELNEIHDVDIKTNVPINGDILGYNGTLWVNKTIAGWLGYTPADQAITISTTAPLSGGGNLSANRTLSIAQANATTNGYLSSADWTTFNNKQAALNGTGFVKASGTTISYDDSTYTPTSRTITINGTTQDLTANQNWTIPVIPSLTNGSVLFSDGTTIAQDNSNFFWDDTNNRLGVGINAPLTKLHIKGNASSTTDEVVLTLDGGGDNGKIIEFRNVNAPLASIAGTKLSAAPTSTNDGVLTFSTGTDGVITEKMRITNIGYVSIGASSSLVSPFSVNSGNFPANSFGIASLMSIANAGVDIGAQLTMGGYFNTGTTILQKAPFAGIAGRKENSTLGDAKGYLALLTNSGSTLTERVRITSTGATTVQNLAGSGTRMVVADSNGLLATQAIPSNGAYDYINMPADTLVIVSSNVEYITYAYKWTSTGSYYVPIWYWDVDWANMTYTSINAVAQTEVWELNTDPTSTVVQVDNYKCYGLDMQLTPDYYESVTPTLEVGGSIVDSYDYINNRIGFRPSNGNGEYFVLKFVVPAYVKLIFAGITPFNTD